MLDSIQIFKEEEFIFSFVKKLENFLKKAPIQAYAKIIKNQVFIEVLGFSKPFVYEIDFHQSVKKNIHEIYEKLFKEYYPEIEIIKKEERPLNPEEIELLMKEKNISLEEALIKKKELIEVEKFKINRVLITKDQLFLKNEKEEKLYSLKMPVSIFLKRLREKWDSEQVSAVFEKYAVFEKDIYPNKLWKEKNDYKKLD